MKKILLVITMMFMNLSAYYGVIEFKNEYGFIMQNGWLQEIKDDRYEIYIASDKEINVGFQKIYVKFKNVKPKKVQISIITNDNEDKRYLTSKILNENEWYAKTNIPKNCKGNCKVRISIDEETLKDINLYIR